MAGAEAFSIEKCEKCKSPTKETSRSLCTTCLNKNLQRACEKNPVILSAPSPPRIFRGVPRALFPGMPRAVLGPVNLEKCHLVPPPCCKTTTIFGNGSAPSLGVRTPDFKLEVDSTLLRDNLNDSGNKKVELADGIRGEGRSFPVGEKEDELRPEEVGAGVAPEKWQIFQVQKNLTLRIPNPHKEVPTRHVLRQPLVVLSKEHSHNNSLPLRGEIRPKAAVRSSHLKRSSIKSNASAEAELMMRLLSDSMPILKSTAPLLLPPCGVRPAPMSPLSPPGDPLWKRRCIPCPKSLRVQVTSICAN